MVLASAMSGAHISRAFSSNERTRPANRACGPSGPANQALSASRFRPFGFFKNAAMDFSDSQRGDKEILTFLLPHPGQQRSRRLRLDGVANDAGIKKVACHRSSLRSFSLGRLRSRSALTSGERRSAASTPPVFGGSSAIACCMVRRSSPASGPSAVNFRARARISSRSASSVWISNRAIPRLVQARSIVLDGSFLRAVAHRSPSILYLDI